MLRLREIAEQHEERALGQVISQMAQQRTILTDLAQQRERIRHGCEAALGAKISASEIHLWQAQIRALEDREEIGRNQLLQLEEHRQAQMKTYQLAHRNRELLSHIREEQMDQFRRVQIRKEQLMMDDNFSCRR